ncbi:hypothetical protein [Nocardioides sp. Kera G14]|uniref:hypothetical protein n=1 Tax=Nocardioides sp. Kera G14 TaxID=2884264 RepID=UPI001D0FFA20|nr:hypothetical protein [Nocardioides sp. Kera G14]UDY23983.1 hypothetical protein LH076_01410 [Nocardioides sp. Kera G14]
MIVRIAASILVALGPSGDVAFSFDDPDITESSALVALPNGDFVTTNDSGDSGRVFLVSPDGKTLRVSDWADDATDVEALAPVGWPARSDRVWVGDIGDNANARDTIEVTQAKVGLGGQETLEGFTPLELRYPDGAHDAETLMAAPDGRLLIVTKGFLGGTLYAVPTHSRPAGAITLEPLSSTGAMLPMATDGAFLPDGKHFLLRGYTSATLYAWPSLDRLGSMPLPHQKQGEGLGIAADGSLWLSSEGVHADVLHTELSPALRALVDGGTPNATPTSTETAPAPAREGDSSPSDGESGTRGWWPWIGGGIVAVGLIAYLLRRRA